MRIYALLLSYVQSGLIDRLSSLIDLVSENDIVSSIVNGWTVILSGVFLEKKIRYFLPQKYYLEYIRCHQPNFLKLNCIHLIDAANGLENMWEGSYNSFRWLLAAGLQILSF